MDGVNRMKKTTSETNAKQSVSEKYKRKLLTTNKIGSSNFVLSISSDVHSCLLIVGAHSLLLQMVFPISTNSIHFHWFSSSEILRSFESFFYKGERRNICRSK
jgi:hypothetical protein